MKTLSIFFHGLIIVLLSTLSFKASAQRPICCTVNCPNSSCVSFGTVCGCGCNDAGFGVCNEIYKISVSSVQKDNILQCKAYCIEINSGYGNDAAAKYQQIHDLLSTNNNVIDASDGTENANTFYSYVNDLVGIINNNFTPTELSSFQILLAELPH